MYGRLFESTFDGSMLGSGSAVFAVWAYVIAKQRDGEVELHPKLLSAIIGDPVEVIEEAIEKLCSPDPMSRNKDEEGRRLIHIQSYKYRVVSAHIYAAIKSDNDRREYNRRKQAEHRAKKAGKSPPVNDEKVTSAIVTKSALSDADSDSKSDTHQIARPRVVVGNSQKAEPDPAPEDDGTWKASGCPVDLVSKLDGLGVVRQLAETLGANPVAVRAELEAFVGYWTIGKGMGQQRTGWPGKARQWVLEQHRKPGGLKAPGAIEHEHRSSVPLDIARIAGSILKTM